MMMTKNIYNAIVAEVEEMAILVMNNDNVKKVKYVKVGDRKFRVTFFWNASKKESVVRVEEKINGYEEVLEWDSTKTDETFPDFFMNFIKESIKKEINCMVKFFASFIDDVDDKKVKNLYEQECQNKAEYTGFTVDELMEMVEYKKA